MTRQQIIERQRERLIARRRQLLDLLSGELSQLHNCDDAIGGDLIDLSVEVDYATVNSTLAEAESREIELIEAALQRWDEGTYGHCCDCGKAISVARLQAIPYAVDCITCTKTKEAKQRVFKLFSEDGDEPESISASVSA